MKIMRLAYILIFCLFISCEDETKESMLTSEESVDGSFNGLDNVPVREGTPIATFSSCSPTDDILFDAPVDNTIQEVNRSSFGMGNWQLVDLLSDEFDYPGGKSAPVFTSKWKYGFVNSYTGPLPTQWTGDQITFETLSGSNRALVLTAADSGSGAARRLKCGMITSNAKSSFPIFQEARVKISNSQLANAVWMLSDDAGTTEEIDNLEAYGPRLRPDNTQCEYPYYADRIHLSHHTFETQNGVRLDYQPHKQTWMSRKKTTGNCNRTNDVVWSEDYHYFGVKWVNKHRLEYFIDGQRVKIVKGLRVEDGIDPEYYTDCNGLSREMHMIISQAAQAWRYGGTANFWNSTDIKSGADTKMYVDWIRVYSPSGQVNTRTCN
ncbi:hypothetical protein [Wenyingzhuangia sp. IMCC45574]